MIQRTLKASPPSRIIAVKPEAPYRLETSRRVHAGTFLLDATTPYPTIRGNYRPDPYSPGAVMAALGATPST